MAERINPRNLTREQLEAQLSYALDPDGAPERGSPRDRLGQLAYEAFRHAFPTVEPSAAKALDPWGQLPEVDRALWRVAASQTLKASILRKHPAMRGADSHPSDRR